MSFDDAGVPEQGQSGGDGVAVSVEARRESVEAGKVVLPDGVEPLRKSFSLPLGALRDARRAWRTEQTRVHAGLPEHEPTTPLVVGRWDYLGSGYSPGATLLAAHVWHRKELEQQFTAEGGS